MRIHIGKISPALADDIDSLKSRLERFGPVVGAVELGRKPLGDFFYAYVDLDIDQKGYAALRSSLHGASFRQSHLSIEQAKPKYETLVAARNQVEDATPSLNLNQMKRLHSHKREIDVFPGRHREIPRKTIKTMTIRVKKGDRVVHVHNKKTKLWGLEKRDPTKMVHEFVDGVWRDFNGNAVQIATNDETVRNKEMLAEVTKQDGPALYLSDSDFEEFRNRQTVLADAEYSDGEIEVVSRAHGTEFTRHTSESQRNEDSDEEMMDNSEGVPVKPQPLNETEALRDVLSVSAPFTLFGGPPGGETGPETETILVTPGPTAPVPAPVPFAAAAPKQRDVGLFFSHTASAFLRSQAQWMKFSSTFDPEAWEKSFWTNRGEWNRVLRRRRKEQVKQSRKPR